MHINIAKIVLCFIRVFFFASMIIYVEHVEHFLMAKNQRKEPQIASKINCFSQFISILLDKHSCL